MGAVAAVRILHRRKLPEVAPDIRPQVEAELAAEHERIAGGVDKAVEIGVVDEVVEPARHPPALAQRHRRRRPRAPRGRTATSRSDGTLRGSRGRKVTARCMNRGQARSKR